MQSPPSKGANKGASKARAKGKGKGRYWAKRNGKPYRQVPCKYYRTSKGCPHGRSCTYKHDSAGSTNKSEQNPKITIAELEENQQRLLCWERRLEQQTLQLRAKEEELSQAILDQSLEAKDLLARKRRLEQREADVSEAQQAVDAHLTQVVKREGEVKQAWDDWLRHDAALKRQLGEPPSVVELNVGGQRYATLRSTLTRHEGSMLAAMFSGRHLMAKDKKGRYFVDRNPSRFGAILDKLRCGSWSQKQCSDLDMDLLVEDCHYFGVPPPEVVEAASRCKCGAVHVLKCSRGCSWPSTACNMCGIEPDEPLQRIRSVSYHGYQTTISVCSNCAVRVDSSDD